MGRLLVAFDTTFLSLALNEMTDINPENVDDVGKVRSLVGSISKKGGRILIPAPSLAEFLAIAPDIKRVAEKLEEYSVYEIIPFDEVCAMQLGRKMREIRESKSKKDSGENWQKVKFDYQIAVTAEAYGVDVFYTNDKKLCNFVIEFGMRCMRIENLLG